MRPGRTSSGLAAAGRRDGAGLSGQANDEADGLPWPRRGFAVAAITCGNVVTGVDATIANVALPTIGKALAVPDSQTVLVVTAYQLVLLVTVLPLSALGDRIGHRRMFMAGQVLFAAATASCLLAHTLGALVLVRCVQALGAAASVSVSSALLRDAYPTRLLGRGLGFNTMMVTASLAASPSVAGAILSVADWPWLFAAELPLALLTLVFIPALPERTPTAEPFDRRSAALCMGSLGAIGIGLELLVHGGAPELVLALVLLAAGGAIAIALVRRMHGESRPLVPVDLFDVRTIRLTLIGLLPSYGAAIMAMIAVPFLLAHTFHLAPLAVGATMSAWAIGMMIGSPLSGGLSDRIAPSLLGRVGILVAALATAAAAAVPALMGANPLAVLVLAWTMAVAGGAYGFCYTSNVRLILTSAPRDRAGVGGSLVAVTRFAGQLLGASGMAALLAAGASGGGLGLGFAAVVAFSGLIVFMARDRRRSAAELVATN